LWLQNNIEPKHMVFDIWEQTTSFRMINKLQENQIKMFPVLRSPHGPFLV
jgi:hypothetical protein